MGMTMKCGLARWISTGRNGSARADLNRILEITEGRQSFVAAPLPEAASVSAATAATAAPPAVVSQPLREALLEPVRARYGEPAVSAEPDEVRPSRTNG